MMTSGCRHASSFDYIGRPLSKTILVLKAVRYYYLPPSVYRPLHRPCITPTSLPNQHHISSRPAIASSCLPCHQSTWTTHQPPRHDSVPDPTWRRHADVIRKNVPKAKFPYLAQNHSFFVLFAKEVIVCPAWNLRRFRHQPTKIDSKAVAGQNSAWISLQPSRCNQVFTKFFLHLVHFVLHCKSTKNCHFLLKLELPRPASN